MSELLTDEQQAERARSWIRGNGLFIVAGVVLGLGGLFGWQQWNDYRVQQAGQASDVWEQMRRALDGERINEAMESLSLLESDYARTPYLDQARLAMARTYMDRNDPDAAAKELQQVVRNGRDPTLRRIAELRLAQLLIAEQRFEEAASALGSSDTSPFAAQFHELRGDMAFYQGDYENALNEYESALDTDVAGIIDRSYVQIKRDDVIGRIATAGMTSQTPAVAE